MRRNRGGAVTWLIYLPPVIAVIAVFYALLVWSAEELPEEYSDHERREWEALNRRYPIEALNGLGHELDNVTPLWPERDEPVVPVRGSAGWYR